MVAEPATELSQRTRMIADPDDDDNIIISSIGILELREIPREQAKQEIRDLMLDNKVRYYSDIMEAVRVDLPLVVELCEELIAEGKLEEVDLGDALSNR